MIETIRLFKAVPVSVPTVHGNLTYGVDAFEIYRKTLPKGFVLAPSVIDTYTEIDTLIKMVDAECGLDPNRLNKAFHKSFGKVQAASMEQLFVEQMAHYITTYGAEFFGVYDADRVFIPTERLDVPAIDIEKFEFVVIRGLTVEQIKVEVLNLLATGAALSEQSVKDVLTICTDLITLTPDEVHAVRNKEVKIGLYDHFGITPSDPVEFLRYLVYKTTGNTLLIKNGATVAAIKAGVAETNLTKQFDTYINTNKIDRLGEIFLRFKPLFLAFRADKALRPTINAIRRAADTAHKPMTPDFLNGVTAASRAGTLNIADLHDELANPNINVFRKVRLANALAVRANADLDSIVYRVRNGKSYATDFAQDGITAERADVAFRAVLSSIAAGLSRKVAGKNVYIPAGISLGLPATEKQFTGNLPAGTFVAAPADQALVAGVYWEDQAGKRIDLDLSIANVGGKIGWDGSYRNADRSVLFSGDNTSAPNGASEVFWFSPHIDGSWLMSVNYYNIYNGYGPVPFQIVVGTAEASDISKNFVFDPNRLLVTAPSVIEENQMTLGMILAVPGAGHRFYLASTVTGGGITSRYNAHSEKARKFMVASMLNAPTLNEVLTLAGANFVDDSSLADEGLNLSPQAIDKTTLLSLLS